MQYLAERKKKVDMSRYILSPEADGDLIDIWKYMRVEVVPRLPTELLLRFAERSSFFAVRRAIDKKICRCAIFDISQHIPN